MRVASLYLPTLSTDRIARRQPEAKSERQAPSPATCLHHPAPPRPEEEREGARIGDCSCPREGHWRPGARWAKNSLEDDPPAHRRPTIRELGRRTEAAETVFRKESPRALPPSPAKAGEGIIVTAHRVGGRVLIAAACPAARALGLHPGMAVTQARALVPGLDVRDSDPEGDRALLASLALFAARRWTPRAAVSGEDGLFLDLTGVAHLFGREENMCRRIIAFCARAGFDARIAAASTPGAAYALARHSPGPLAFCPSGAEAEALAPLPLAALRLEEGALAAARRLGIDRIGELFAMPRAPLSRRFGKSLLTRLDQALGRSGEAIEPVVPEDPPSAELRFPEPIATAEAIAEAMAELLRRLLAGLEKKGLAARVFTLGCERVDGERQSLEIGTARATRDGRHLLRLLSMRIEEIEPGFGLDSMRLTAGRCEPLAPQPIEGALAGETPPPDLSPLVDRLAGRLGARSLYRAGSVESDVPERSVRRVHPLAPASPWPAWPRPVRLLAPPERVDNVVALLPDLPPRRFTWRGRSYRVARADGPERIYGEWWRRAGEAEAVRDYFQVEDEEGARFWLYRRGDGIDPGTGDLSWYMHGVFG